MTRVTPFEPNGAVSREQFNLRVEEINQGIGEVAAQLGNIATVAEHSKVGIMHKLQLAATATEGLQQVAFMATAPYNEGDTWGVNGVAYTAEVAGEDGALPELLFVTGNIVSLTLDPIGKKLGFKSGGKPRVPDIFGDGSDGDLYIKAGETVVLPVTVPHQSVVEKQYKSIIIEAGGLLKCSDNNAGLVLRCKGDCTIHGTIDQSLMAPKTNPNNNYRYPTELLCGNGGNGGYGGANRANEQTGGGVAMAANVYGGGFGAGGGGGHGYTGGVTNNGGIGGSSNTITVSVDNIFIGGEGGFPGGSGRFGGGAGGGQSGVGLNKGGVGPGGSAGGPYSSHGGSGGGAGNYGGGVLLLYTGGHLTLDGSILCNGGNGGNGGDHPNNGGTGGGGGGGGGGAIYICYNDELSRLEGNLNADGGPGGRRGDMNYPINGVGFDERGGNGAAGTIGTVSIKQHVKGMTV